MPTLKDIVERDDIRTGRIFDLSVQLLIVLSLVAYSLETLPDVPDQARRTLWYFEVVSVIVFTIEYVLRVAVARPKRKYIFSFLGLVDLIAILPFYFGLVVDLRSVRVLRMLRLFRIFKLVRYNSAVRRFHRALLIAKEELVLFLTVTVILLYLAAVGIYHFEHHAQPEAFASVFHSLWWSIITLTTVGYGDVYPITLGGRVFTFFLLIIGLGVVSVPAGLLASSLNKARQVEDELQAGEPSERAEPAPPADRA